MEPAFIVVVAFLGVLSNIAGARSFVADIYAWTKKLLTPPLANPERHLVLAGYSDIDPVIPSNPRSTIIQLSKGSTPIPQWTGATSTLSLLTVVVLLGVLLAIGNLGQDAIGFRLSLPRFASSLSTITIHVEREQGSTDYVSVGGRAQTLLPLSPDTEVVVFEKPVAGAAVDPSSSGWYAVGRTTPTADGSWAIARVKFGEGLASHSPTQLYAIVASPASPQLAWPTSSCTTTADGATQQFRLLDPATKKLLKKASGGRTSSLVEFTAVLVNRDAIALGTHTDTLEQLRPKVLSQFAQSVVVSCARDSAAKPGRSAATQPH
jgi:hypothetical protein